MTPSSILAGAYAQFGTPLLVVAGLVLVWSATGRGGHGEASADQEAPVTTSPPAPVTLRQSAGSMALAVEQEARSVLQELSPAAREGLVRLEIAVQSGLEVRADPRVYRDVLAGLLRHAIAQAPGGRVLLTAARHGGRVQVAVVDDGAGSDPRAQQSSLRDSERLIALQGGTLEINSRPGEGTTVVARWPDFQGERKVSARAEPAGQAVPDLARAETAVPH